MEITILSTLLLDIAPVMAAFKPLKIKARVPCHFKLSKLSNIPYQCWKFQDQEAKLSVWEDSLDFSFGQLNQSQWQEIAQTYGKGHSIAPYNPGHDYWLMDFMPPLMQAINRHRFESERRTAPQALAQSTQTITILSNCWGTLYELLRLKNQTTESTAYLMMVEPSQMLATLQSVSKPVEQAKTGDFLLISHRHRDEMRSPQTHNTYLDHGAFFVDQDLLFEKAGAGDAVPYRLIDLKTLQTIWRPDVFDYQVRRPIAKKALPHPLSFSQSATTSLETNQYWTVIRHRAEPSPNNHYYSIYPLPALVQSQGRFILDEQAYRSKYYGGDQ